MDFCRAALDVKNGCLLRWLNPSTFQSGPEERGDCSRTAIIQLEKADAECLLMSEGGPWSKPRPFAQKVRVQCKTGTRGDDTDSLGFPDSFVTNLIEELRVGEPSKD